MVASFGGRRRAIAEGPFERQREEHMSGRMLARLIVAFLLGLASTAQAALTVYTDQAAFLAAVTAPGTDTFDDLQLLQPFPGPLSRTAGPYSYSASTTSTDFYNPGSAADVWLSTNVAADTITFNAIPANVRGIGGRFFATDFDGAVSAGQTVTLVATDGGGNVTRSIVNGNETSFLGFVSTGPLTALTISAIQLTPDTAWPTVNNLILAAAAAPPAVLISAASRKVHGAAGTFDLPLTLTPLTNPTTEPRQGPTATVVMTFDKAIASATTSITEGVATPTLTTFGGNDVVISLSGVSDQQYVTVSLTNVTGADGSTAGTGTVRIGFLRGDVNQSRVVSVADLGLVNAQLAQPVTAVNFLKDVNASGTLTLADKGIANANLTKALLAP
jgi:hypothetical protein